jgi:hypothetical protein
LEDVQMRPRTAGKIAVGLMIVGFATLALIYTFEVGDMTEDFKHAVRAISFGILSLTAATGYRYFED